MHVRYNDKSFLSLICTPASKESINYINVDTIIFKELLRPKDVTSNSYQNVYLQVLSNNELKTG